MKIRDVARCAVFTVLFILARGICHAGYVHNVSTTIPAQGFIVGSWENRTSTSATGSVTHSIDRFGNVASSGMAQYAGIVTTTFTATGDITFGTTTIAGNLIVSGTFTGAVTLATTTIAGNLTVNGKVTGDGSGLTGLVATSTNSLALTGGTMMGPADMGGYPLTSVGSMTVQGAFTSTASAITIGTATFNSATFNGYATFKNTVTFEQGFSTTTFPALRTSGYMNVGSSLSIDGGITGTTATLTGGVYSTGQSTFSDIRVQGPINITGTTSISTATVTGALTVNGASSLGAATISSVTVSTYFTASGPITTGTQTVRGGINVDGYVTWSGSGTGITSNSTATLAAQTISGYSTINGTSTLNGALTASTATFTGPVTISTLSMASGGIVTLNDNPLYLRTLASAFNPKIYTDGSSVFNLHTDYNGSATNSIDLQASENVASARIRIRANNASTGDIYFYQNALEILRLDTSGLTSSSATFNGSVIMGTTTIHGNVMIDGALIVKGTTNVTGSGGGGGSSARGYIFKAPGDAFISTSTNLGIDWDSKPYMITVSSGRLTARMAPTGGGSSYTFCVDGSTASMPTFHLPSNTTSQITPVASFAVTIASYSTVGFWCLGTGSSTAASDVWMQLYGTNP